ncbi:MAG: hypothetical protein KIT84_08665 [Labilithrix sp.]|nr:hypothetical protein [Labilithrix sp.]MCW5811071.1 hypothetical protein [Labilithrix sp.]
MVRAVVLLPLVGLAVGCAATEPLATAPSVTVEAPLTEQELARTWVKIAAPHGNMKTVVVRGPDGYVALARDQPPTGGKLVGPVVNHLYRSTDGVTWHKLPLPARESIYGKVDLAYGAGRWVMLEHGGQATFPWTSTDLVAWSKPSVTRAFDAQHVVRVDGHFFGLGPQAIQESPDGVTWTTVPLDVVQGRAVASGNGCTRPCSSTARSTSTA